MKRYFLLPVIAFGLCIYIIANQLNPNDTSEAKLPTPDIEFVGPEITITEDDLIDINQMHCLATNIYHEARGESYAGKVAVANVTMNRVKYTLGAKHSKKIFCVCGERGGEERERERERERGERIEVLL